ncbi:MAG: transporter [Bacteroidales bacterium]|nr:transporter [Bacteroidales bacterium]
MKRDLIKLSIITFLLLFLHNTVKSQIDSSINFVTDRPGMATSTDIITSRCFQVEDGFQFEKIYNENLSNKNFLFSSLLLRYGIVKNVELRLQTDYVYNIVTDNINTFSIYGFNPITIGTKIQIFEQKKFIPDVSFLFNLVIPFWGKKEFIPNNFAPSFTLLMSNDISEKLNLCYNYGIFWDGTSSVPNHFYAICFGINFSKKWNAFIEGYGFTNPQTNSLFYIDVGSSYLINKRFQIDFSVSRRLNSSLNYYCLNTGIAWQI